MDPSLIARYMSFGMIQGRLDNVPAEENLVWSYQLDAERCRVWMNPDVHIKLGGVFTAAVERINKAWDNWDGESETFELHDAADILFRLTEGTRGMSIHTY